MRRWLCLIAAWLFVAGVASAQDQAARKLPDGVYAVLREGAMEKDVLPLKKGEALAVQRHRYAKNDAKEPPRYLVVRTAPDVKFDLASEPKADKQGDEVVRILLKLKPAEAAALERLTAGRIGEKVAIILDGDVVTMHKIREAIQGGEVQITNCAAGAANFLFEHLRAYHKKK